MLQLFDKDNKPNQEQSATRLASAETIAARHTVCDKAAYWLLGSAEQQYGDKVKLVGAATAAEQAALSPIPTTPDSLTANAQSVGPVAAQAGLHETDALRQSVEEALREQETGQLPIMSLINDIPETK